MIELQNIYIYILSTQAFIRGLVLIGFLWDSLRDIQVWTFKNKHLRLKLSVPESSSWPTLPNSNFFM